MWEHIPEFKQPEYDKGFSPGAWATISGRDCKLYARVDVSEPHIKLGGPAEWLNTDTWIFVIARPDQGNPWEGAHLGIVYVLVQNPPRLGWMWASDLREREQ